MKHTILLLICMLISQSKQASDYKRVCVYPNWSVLRPVKIAKMFPEDIKPTLCTHIHYAYANINVRTLELMPSLRQDVLSGEHGAPLYERIIKLRQMNPRLKILISVGGFFAKSTSFDQVVASDGKRKKFVENVLKFLHKWKFDGIDIQWEYPGEGAAPDSKERFTSLLQSLNYAFKTDGFLLSAFGPADEAQIDAGYQVKEICQLVDYLSVETYDYSGFKRLTAYNSPLYSRAQFQECVNKSINSWLERGCPKRKLLVGIATYARTYKVLNKQSNALIYYGTEAEPVMTTSNYTLEEGTLSYFEICELMKNQEAKTFWDHRTHSSFAVVKGKEPKSAKNDLKSVPYSLWITYEDGRSARKKAEFIKNNTLGGATFWTIDMDDFKGAFCKIEPFPIIESVKEELEINYIPTKVLTRTRSLLTPSATPVKSTYNLTTTTTTATTMINLRLVDKKTSKFNLPATTIRNRLEVLMQENSTNYKIIRAIKLIGCVDAKNCYFKNEATQIGLNNFAYFLLFIIYCILKINKNY